MVGIEKKLGNKHENQVEKNVDYSFELQKFME